MEIVYLKLGFVWGVGWVLLRVLRGLFFLKGLFLLFGDHFFLREFSLLIFFCGGGTLLIFV